jgi:hypothetical protein
MGESLGVGNVVDGRDFDIFPLEGHFEDTSANPAESVDRDFHEFPRYRFSSR